MERERCGWASVLGWAAWSTQALGTARSCVGHHDRDVGAGGTRLLPAHRPGRQLHPLFSPFPFRPRRMNASPSGRSWLWAVSSTMAPGCTPAAARAASPACPHGKPGASSPAPRWSLRTMRCLQRDIPRPFVASLALCLQTYS